jgi:uncharacterized membrane protein SirB2
LTRAKAPSTLRAMDGYTAMLQLHVSLVTGSVLLFLIRGFGTVWGAPWPMDDRLRILGGGLDTMVTLVGLSLWGLLRIDPVNEPWLASKFLFLALYILFATLTLKGAKSTHGKLLCYVLALVSVTLLTLVSRTRLPLGGF